jgi:hypothetical protein
MRGRSQMACNIAVIVLIWSISFLVVSMLRAWLGEPFPDYIAKKIPSVFPMSIGRGEKPPFNRLIADINRAEIAWDAGDKERSFRILKLVASIAISNSSERGPYDPVPEVAR